MLPVPEGLESWLHCAMDPEPEGRFRRAVDALWALPTGERPGSARLKRETTDANSAPDFAEAPTLPPMNTDDASETLTPTLPPTISIETADHTIPETESAPERSPDDAPGGLHQPGPTDASIPPIPESWRTPRNESLPVPLVGTGLGLFGLREPPFVDRVNERERIWDVLRDVERNGEPRVLLVTGASGVGKSRLVEWMATRAHELGAAGTLRAMHTSGEETAIEGIRAMARRMFRAQKLDRQETYEHLLDALPPLADGSVDRETDARGLTELLHPTPGDQPVDGPRYRFSSAGQKHALIARLLRRFRRRRPVFLWLDDAQWGPAAMDFAEYLLENSLEQPSAFVAVTLRSDILVEDASLEQRVEALLSHDGCSRLHLDPLADAHHRTFVQRLLPLQRRLLERISEKTEGNALFARQLVGHLVDRERLEATPEGFRIREEASLTLPEDIHALWMQRLSRFVDAQRHGSKGAVWAALERAAALGREVASEEWCALWESLQLEEPEAAVDNLAERGLAERTDEGWSFTHGMLVDSLERRSRERGNWKAHHRACVELLEALHFHRPLRTAARRAEHCIEAGEFERALEPLLRESTRLRRSGETSAVRRILEKREELLETLEIDRADPRRIQNDIRLAHARFESGEPPEGELDSVRDALRRAEGEEFDALTADACRVAGILTQALNRYDRVRHFLERGVDLARAASATALLSKNLRKLGWVECESGNLDRSDELHSEALEAALRTDNPYLPAATRRNMAWLALSRGERDRSRELFEEVLAESREAGLRALELPCLNGLGELAKFDGAAESARSYYRRFQRLARELDRPAYLAVCYLNLGQVDLLAGDCGSAAHSIRRADSRFEELGQRDQFARSLDFARLAHAACAGDWRRFDEILDRQLGEKDDVRIVKDHPWLVEMAGDYSADAGERDRARRAWQFARNLWRNLGDETATERTAKKLEDDER